MRRACVWVRWLRLCVTSEARRRSRSIATRNCCAAELVRASGVFIMNLQGYQELLKQRLNKNITIFIQVIFTDHGMSHLTNIKTTDVICDIKCNSS